MELNGGCPSPVRSDYSLRNHQSSSTSSVRTILPAVVTRRSIRRSARTRRSASPDNTVPLQPSLPTPHTQENQDKELLELLRDYPVMWNGCIALKKETAHVQCHLISGSPTKAEGVINAIPNLGPGPMQISKRMQLEPSQISGVQERMQQEGQWCVMLALPHGTDPLSGSNQTTALQQGFISYLERKQAAGIVGVPLPNQSSSYVLHIFPPCDFTFTQMCKFCPEIIRAVTDCGYLLIVIANV